MSNNIVNLVWNNIIIEAKLLINSEPILTNFICQKLLKYPSFQDILICNIIQKLSNIHINKKNLITLISKIYHSDYNIIIAAAYDIHAIRLKDPSVTKYLTPFLYFKGFHVLQIYRIAHWLWTNNRQELAMYLHHHINMTYNVDIHPAAKIGYSVILDHASGIVIGETSIIENNVSIMQSVTLGSTGKIKGDRHPKIRNGVMIGAHSIILGNIEIGKGAKIGAGSVVIHPVPAYTTVTGQAAKIIKKNHISI